MEYACMQMETPSETEINNSGNIILNEDIKKDKNSLPEQTKFNKPLKKSSEEVFNKTDYKFKLEDKDYILTIEYNEDCFILKLKDVNDISFNYYKNTFDLLALQNCLKLDNSIYTDFQSIINLITELYLNNKISIKKDLKENYFILFIKNNDILAEILLNNCEMNKKEKFGKIINEIDYVKNFNENKFNELVEISKKIESDVDYNTKKNNELLNQLQDLSNKNSTDVDFSNNEVKKLKQEITDIKEYLEIYKNEIKNEENGGNGGSCLII